MPDTEQKPDAPTTPADGSADATNDAPAEVAAPATAPEQPEEGLLDKIAQDPGTQPVPAPDVPDSRTYGEKLAGVNFNPSNDPNVDAIKKKAAILLDELNDQRSESQTRGAGSQPDHFYARAIDEIVNGQMLGVKAATWKD